MGTIADGNTIYADDILGSMRTTVEAGEIISTGETCYIKLNDGKAYVSDNATQLDYRVDGIAIAGVASGADVTLITRGKIVTTGLTDKEVYYLGAQDAAVGGLLGVTTTQTAIKIGVADGTTDLYIDIVQDDRDMVGTIKGVHLDLTGVPSLTAFWALMDGSTLTDTESPLTGQTFRDLNANNEFLRGGDASAGTGGAATHVHVSPISQAFGGMVSFGSGSYGTGAAVSTNLNVTVPSGTSGNSAGFKTSTVNAEPPYMDVVWVIKIK